LVLPWLGLVLSWQMPESDFLTAGSAASLGSAAWAKPKPQAKAKDIKNRRLVVIMYCSWG
jgi:hypothetical protein